MSNRYKDINKKLELTEFIHQIVFLIINREDYKSAAKILIENEIQVEDILKNTHKLTSMHIAKLADSLNLKA